MLTDAALAHGTFVPVVVGVMLGGVISVFIIRRELGPTAGKKGMPSPNQMTFAMGLRRMATIYLAVAFLLFVVAVITGGVAPIVTTGLNLALALLGLVVAGRSGGPKTSR